MPDGNSNTVKRPLTAQELERMSLAVGRWANGGSLSEADKDLVSEALTRNAQGIAFDAYKIDWE